MKKEKTVIPIYGAAWLSCSHCYLLLVQLFTSYKDPNYIEAHS